MSNQLQRVVESSKWLPANIRATVVSKILGKVVPYVGTTGLLYEEISSERVIVSIRNQHKVQNHIKNCLLYTSPSPRDGLLSRMPSSA